MVKGYNDMPMGEKSFQVFYTSMVSKKRPRQALRLGIKICVIREHRNSLTSFFPPQRTKVMHPLHRNMSDVDVLETVNPEN